MLLFVLKLLPWSQMLLRLQLWSVASVLFFAFNPYSLVFCALSFFYHFGTSIDDCFWIWEFPHLWWNCSLTLMSSQWHMQTISYECSNSISNLNGTVIPISYEFQNGGWTLPLEVKFVYSSWRKAYKILANAALFRFFLLWISMSKETFFFGTSH